MEADNKRGSGSKLNNDDVTNTSKQDLKQLESFAGSWVGDSGYGSESIPLETDYDLESDTDENTNEQNKSEENIAVSGSEATAVLADEARGEASQPTTPNAAARDETLYRNVMQALTPDNDGDTFLHILPTQGRTEEMKQLIALCPDARYLNVQNRQGQAALHICAYLNLFDEITCLLCRNARADLVDCDGNNILHLCAKKGCTESCTRILDLYQRAGNTVVVSSLCRATNYAGRTPLYTAVVHKHKDVCWLLSNRVGGDVDVNMGDVRTGTSPLHEAVMTSNNADFVYFLLKYCGVDVDAVDKQNVTALHIAANNNDEAVCAVLLEFNARKDVVDVQGNTPVVYTNNESIIQKLNG